ncbi:MAG TPA: hypothetical protein VMY42_02715 [Thermoguttaceae bacterium]|nr:hypothetical protein [Thermoguttaceae bacterium]
MPASGFGSNVSRCEGPPASQQCTPCCEGISPVSSVARVGEQTELELKHRVKSIPSCASRSIFGVRISRLP